MTKNRIRGKKRASTSRGLPPVGVLEIVSIDSDGVAKARPARWSENDPVPEIRIEPDRRAGHAIGVGDRVLAKLTRGRSGEYLAKSIRRLPAERPRTVLGIFQLVDGKGRLHPTNRRIRSEFLIPRHEDKGARPGELVRAEIQPSRRAGLPEARVLERLGEGAIWQIASLIAIEEYGIPDRFPEAALDEADAAVAAPLGRREDLRALPFMTIDDETARDFDDAVWAAPDPNSDNSGGFNLIVAIADVAWYVPPGSALDAEARERGNSVYFPDRVVPMLPEPLSNKWCSLKPHEDRPCIAVHIRIDAEGNKRGHRFSRAIICSAARQSYKDVQAAIEGDRSIRMCEEIGALHGAYTALARSRARRGTLDLNIPERRVRLAPDGRIEGVESRETLTANRLIEEFMIAANVAAAESLETHGAPCVYRVHEVPDAARVQALRQLLNTFGLWLPRGERLRPHHFNALLERASSTEVPELLHEAILRTQAQAVYDLENLGHFGLALARYCHFTSPIRRYADLLVHRSLISALALGKDGLTLREHRPLGDVARHISSTERRATSAEREAVDRLCAAYLEDRVGATMPARISGITRAGLFVRIVEVGADALIPSSMLQVHPVRVDPNGFRLTDGRGRTLFTLGKELDVRILEVNTRTGSILCAVAGGKAPPLAQTGRRKHRSIKRQ